MRYRGGVAPLVVRKSALSKPEQNTSAECECQFFRCAHERQFEAMGFMGRRCVGQVARKSRPFAIEYSYIGLAAINSTPTGCFESHKDGNRHVRRALAIPVYYTVRDSLCAVGHPRFLPAVRSTHDASSLEQINRGLEIVHASGLNFACQLTSNVDGFKSQDSQAPTCMLQSRKLVVLTRPSCLRSLSQNGSEAADAPAYRCPWAHIARNQVLAPESHGAFFFCLAAKSRESLHHA